METLILLRFSHDTRVEATRKLLSEIAITGSNCEWRAKGTTEESMKCSPRETEVAGFGSSRVLVYVLLKTRGCMCRC